MFPRFVAILLAGVLSASAASDSLSPYSAGKVPQNALELWKDIDLKKDPLDTRIIQEWRNNGTVCRYVTFKLGIFKGTDARVAAYYTFPEGMTKGPAFVWSHGGGQRAERTRGEYFARQGFATIDINWGGREMEKGIETNTDWGKVDPSQGPQFYPKALRKNFKSDLLPDEHSIDPVPSPRNSSWFLLAYAGRRAITFLEQQPEVDPGKIGFTGYSMGGTITSIVSIDPRLKAVAPMVGGSGFRLDGFPGLPETSTRARFQHADLQDKTIDPSAYWPHAQCPVLFLSATDDFHATFEKIYRVMASVPHENWHVSQMMHYNHSLGPEQWVLLNLFFDHHLKGKGPNLPRTASSVLGLDPDQGTARYSAFPDPRNPPESIEFYYSHDPNPRARFWKHARAVVAGSGWTANLPVKRDLPLFVFANLTYPLPRPIESMRGRATHFTLTSTEGVHLPESIDAAKLRAHATHIPLFQDFKRNGFEGWAMAPNGGASTYKFQDPARSVPDKDQLLKVTIQVPRDKLSYRFRAGKSQFLIGSKAPKDTFFSNHSFKETGTQVLQLKPSDFKNRDGETMPDWSDISTFYFGIYDGEARTTLDFRSSENQSLIQRMEWVK